MNSPLRGSSALICSGFVQRNCAQRGGFRKEPFSWPIKQSSICSPQHSALWHAPRRGWKQGYSRLSELPREQHFGKLRMQSSNAQLSSRAFFMADARTALRTSRELNGTKPAKVKKPEEPLTEEELLGSRSSLLIVSYSICLTLSWTLSDHI